MFWVRFIECDFLLSSYIGYSVIQFRRFGEPKLTKPKELKGIKQLCSVDYIPKKNKSSLFLKDNDVYVKHTDYFSPIWQPPTNDLGKPVAYYLKKYFNQTPSEKSLCMMIIGLLLFYGVRLG